MIWLKITASRGENLLAIFYSRYKIIIGDIDIVALITLETVEMYF
ncbi:hypothetical protein EDD66_101372 [Mobilisporobacter senegalensis]|uniref:Uncharacterized protein n=1 Tax=Mobilisporobacter senegalensis TaxID=1329262 RepID=A0A3N1XYU2_9FIRM|nr:hypothetical protein EDD66_101372 [Mobilisporobacter senegalensis]